MAGRYTVSSKAARTVDGITFASAAEAGRYAELALLEAAGTIGGLERQPEYELLPPFAHKGGRERGIRYRADFRYRDEAGQVVVEDVKGHRTAVYKLKRKLLLYRYPEIEFKEVRAK